MTPRFLGLWCLLLLCVMLTLGLWPFHAPANNLKWLKETNGVQLKGAGVAWTAGPLTGATDPNAGHSIELWAMPEYWSRSATLLTLYRPEGPAVLTLRQSVLDLIVSEGLRIGKAARDEGVWVDGAFSASLQRKKPVFLTVTSGVQGTQVYVDGVLRKSSSDVRIREDIWSGRLLLGDAPLQPDGFRGRVLGLALYGSELPAPQVVRHYRTWTQSGSPEIVPDEHNVALYRFDERQGTVVHNRATGGSDLEIHGAYTVVDKIKLEPFWREFDFSRSYWRGNVKNLIGFIPWGFFVFAYCLLIGVRRPMLLTLASGTLISVIIEVSQAWLPTRDSGTTDLFTNTLGTYIGVLCYTDLYPAVARRLPRLAQFLKPPTESAVQPASRPAENSVIHP